MDAPGGSNGKRRRATDADAFELLVREIARLPDVSSPLTKRLASSKAAPDEPAASQDEEEAP